MQIFIIDILIIYFNAYGLEFDENSDEKTKLILKSGLLDPYLINGSYHLKIGRIEELTLLNPDHQTKRFKFWIFHLGNQNPLLNSVNPHEYYIELFNENANENSTFEDFVNNAKLTFLKYGGVIHLTKIHLTKVFKNFH